MADGGRDDGGRDDGGRDDGAREESGRDETGRDDRGGSSAGRHRGRGERAGGRDVLGRYALLPLRIFLGVTFVYAGLDKLTDSAFMSESGAGSIGETMRSVRDSSAIPEMVDLALKAPVGFGYAIGVGELAVGIGTLLGVLARLAAVGGALISLSLWFTMTWATEPYYLGNDLAYLMAWLPLVLAGAPYLSVDALWRARRHKLSRNQGS